MTTVTIQWKQCASYAEAQNETQAIYLHEWNGKPFYWGICDVTVFGGNARTIDGADKNPRYGSSYRHWIEGCLRHGGILYIGKIAGDSSVTLETVENILIRQYPSQENRGTNSMTLPEISVTHEGKIPLSISQ